MAKSGQNPVVNVGLSLSLVLNILGFAFSGGVLYQRIVSLEVQMSAAQTHNDKRDESLGEIKTMLARIDERLSQMKGGAPSAGAIVK